MKSFESYLTSKKHDADIRRFAEFVVANNLDVTLVEEWIMNHSEQEIREGIWGGIKGLGGGVVRGVKKVWGATKDAWNQGSSTQDAAKAQKLKDKWAGTDYAGKFGTAGAAVAPAAPAPGAAPGKKPVKAPPPPAPAPGMGDEEGDDGSGAVAGKVGPGAAPAPAPAAGGAGASASAVQQWLQADPGNLKTLQGIQGQLRNMYKALKGDQDAVAVLVPFGKWVSQTIKSASAAPGNAAAQGLTQP